MDHPSDASSTTSSLQAGIEKLIQIGHSAAALSCQIQEAVSLLTGAGESVEITVDDLEPTSRLNTAELMELINLEHSRQALMKSWRYVEGRKAGIIQQARTRNTDAGGAGQ